MISDCCFCTLAPGERYRHMAKDLADDMAAFCPGKKLIILTDGPEDFSGIGNVIAFKHCQQGIFACFNDRRFVVEGALSLFGGAIQIDADSRICARVPIDLKFPPGISACHDNLISHIGKYRPERLQLLRKDALKIGVRLEEFDWIGESLYIIRSDNGREKGVC